jgi:hypothetical protein
MGNVSENLALFYTFVNSFPALLLVYDLWSRRSLHKATMCGVGLIIALQVAVPVLAQSALIGHAVAWLQRT